MSDYSENVALFTKPQSTYTGETGNGPLDSNKQNGGIPDGRTWEGPREVPETSLRKSGVQRNLEGFADTPEDKPSFDEVLRATHEKAMSTVGFGRMQWMLFVVLGFGIMGDSIELMLVAYVLPGAEHELCMDNPMKGWLGKSNIQKASFTRPTQMFSSRGNFRNGTSSWGLLC